MAFGEALLQCSALVQAWQSAVPATASKLLHLPAALPRPALLAAEGAQALTKVQRQLELLLQAEEHTREVRAVQ